MHNNYCKAWQVLLLSLCGIPTPFGPWGVQMENILPVLLLTGWNLPHWKELSFQAVVMACLEVEDNCFENALWLLTIFLSLMCHFVAGCFFSFFVLCIVLCVYTTCFRFVPKDHLGPLLDFGLPVPMSVGLFVSSCFWLKIHSLPSCFVLASSSQRGDGQRISVDRLLSDSKARFLSGSLCCSWYRCSWWPHELILVVPFSPPTWLSPRPWPSSRPWVPPPSHRDARRRGLARGPPCFNRCLISVSYSCFHNYISICFSFVCMVFLFIHSLIFLICNY